MLVNGEMPVEQMKLFYNHFRCEWLEFPILEELVLAALNERGIFFNKNQKRRGTNTKTPREHEMTDFDDVDGDQYI